MHRWIESGVDTEGEDNLLCNQMIGSGGQSLEVKGQRVKAPQEEQMLQIMKIKRPTLTKC